MTPKQYQFCQIAARGDCTGTEAASRAGYKNPSVAATRLFKHPLIQKRIAILKSKYAEQEGVEASILVDQLLTIAMQPSIGTFLTQTEDGEVVWLDPSDWTTKQMAAVKTSIPVKDLLENWHSVELHDRACAISTLIELLNPVLSELQKQAIINALCRIGSQRGFNEVELAILQNKLAVAA